MKHFLLFFLFLLILVLPGPILAGDCGGTKEETAVSNLNVTLPKNFPCQEPASDILSNIGKFFESIGKLFFDKPQNTNTLYSNSENLSRVSTPKEVQPNSDNSADNVEGFLGKNTGAYGAELPLNFADENLQDTEKSYECAIVPCKQGVQPITP